MLALAAILCAFVFTGGAAGDAPRCTYGVSSIGPVTLVHGHLTRNTKPDTEVCLH
jgi:hypothetical protein